MAANKIKPQENRFKEKAADFFSKKESFDYEDGDVKVAVTVKKAIPYGERAEAVYRMAESILPHDAVELSQYSPEIEEAVIASIIIDCFTDFEMPKDIETAWYVIHYSGLMTSVVNIIGENEFGSIKADVEKLVNARRSKIENGAYFDNVLKKVDAFLNTVSDKFSGVDAKEVLDIFKKLPDASVDSLVDSILREKEEKDEKIN